MSSLPQFLQKDAEELSSYRPVYGEIPNHDRPVEKMSRDCPDSLDNRFTPIIWNSEYVEPPYADFYKDGSRWVPELDKMTGYESCVRSLGYPLIRGGLMLSRAMPIRLYSADGSNVLIVQNKIACT
eukprot:6054192-Amphidinium_carterae.2